MPEISDAVELATSTPEEAAENIENAQLMEVDPVAYKEDKVNFQPAIAAMKAPKEATPAVAESMKQSPEHAALLKDDAEPLSYVERYIKDASNKIFDVPSTQRKVNELARKKMNDPDNFTEEDFINWNLANDDLKEQQGKTYDIGAPFEALNSFLGMGSDVIRGLNDNKEIIAGLTVAGAGTGAAIGSVAGPGGAVAVGTMLGSQGLMAGVTAAGFIDGYKEISGSIYNELTFGKDDKGNPLQLDETTKKHISVGAGALASAITSAATFGVAKTIPWVQKFIKPSLLKTYVLNPQNAAVRSAITNIGKSIAIGGTATGSVEAIKIVSEELANSYDPKSGETSFINAMHNIDKRLGEYSARVGKAAVAGAAAGGIVSAVGEGVGFKTNKARFAKQEEARFNAATDVTPGPLKNLNEPQAPSGIPDVLLPEPKAPTPGTTDLVLGPNPGTPKTRAAKALEFQNMLSIASNVTKLTKVYGIAKNQVGQVRQKMLENAGIKNIYVDREDLNKFADTEEKAARVRDIIDPSGTAKGVMNAPVDVSAHDFLDLIDDFPEASELAKLNPEDPTPQQAKAYVEELKTSQENRISILKELGSTELTDEKRAALQQALDTPQPVNDIFGESDYLNQQDYTKMIEAVLPEAEIAKFREAHQNGKMEIVTKINDAARLEMDRVKDVVIEQATEAQNEIEADRIANDPDVAVVEQFRAGTPLYKTTLRQRPEGNAALISELTGSHHKKGFSPLAIDPELLPPKLKKYADNERLKKHKVFVRGGMSPEESARMLGVNSGENLLKILASTDSRQEIIDAQVAKRSKEIQDLADNNVDLNKTAIAEAYNNKTRNDLTVMKYMKDKEWPALKGGIKRIALPLPTIEELNVKARSAVDQIKVADLNVNQFKVGERKSQRAAVQAFLKGDVETAFVNKEAEALNSQFTKEAHIAIGKVNRTIRFARKFNKPEVIQELKDAGHGIYDAAQELLDAFNLSPDKKGTAKREAYNNWVKKMVDRGEGNFEIPEQYWDTRGSLKDMTVEQVRIVGNRLTNLLHVAKRWNKVLKARKKRDIIETVQGYAQALHDVALKNPEYNLDRTFESQGDLPASVAMGESFMQSEALVSNMEHQLLRMDQGKIGGLYNELIFQPLAGTGEFKGQGLDGLQTDRLKLQKHFEAQIEKYGKKEWRKLGMTPVEVPEFETSKLLNNGKLTKADLFGMALNIGNEGNLEALENFGIPKDQILEVLKRELTDKDFEFIQTAVWDVYESLKPRVKALHEATEGVTPEFVAPLPFEINGKMYRGGYYPLKYKAGDAGNLFQSILETADAAKDVLSLADASLKNNYFTQGMTRQGHLITRTGSKNPVDLSLAHIGRNFEQNLTDLNMREPVRDALNLLKDPVIAGDMIAQVGKPNYRMIVNTVIDAANSAQKENVAVFQDNSNFWQKAMSGADSAFSSTVLVGNLNSILIQPTSMFFAWEKMGVQSGAKHLGLVLGKIAANPMHLIEFWKFAEEINPAIRNANEGLDDNITDALINMLPQKRKVTKPIYPLVLARNYINEMGYKALGFADNVQKVVVALSGYSQFIAGEAPGWTKEQILNMTQEERHNKAVGYAASLSRLTLTSGSVLDRAPIQKLNTTKPFVRFWNDSRNALNNTIAASRKVKNEGKSGNYYKSAQAMMSLIAVGAASTLLLRTVRGEQMPWDEDEEINLNPKNKEDVIEAAEIMTKRFAQTAMWGTADRFATNIPVIRDAWNAAFNQYNRSDYKTAGIPLYAAVSDISTAIPALTEILTMGTDAELSKIQIKALLRSTSYATGGIPANALFKAWEFGNENITLPTFGKGEIKKFSEAVDKAKESDEFDPEFIKKLEQMKMQVDPTREPQNAPNEVLEIIKKIESDGKWYAKNPNSSAAGLYQFTEDTWDDIMEKAPELGLTRSGRISDNTDQQESAMKWFTEKNMQALADADLPVTAENIYASHFLGSKGAIDVLQAEGTTKLKTIVGEEVMSANDFRNGMRVKDFKEWLTSKIENAENQLVVDNNNQ